MSKIVDSIIKRLDEHPNDWDWDGTILKCPGGTYSIWTYSGYHLRQHGEKCHEFSFFDKIRINRAFNRWKEYRISKSFKK